MIAKKQHNFSEKITLVKKTGGYEIEFINREGSFIESKSESDLIQFEEGINKFKLSKQQGLTSAIEAAEAIIENQKKYQDESKKIDQCGMEKDKKKIKETLQESPKKVKKDEGKRQYNKKETIVELPLVANVYQNEDMQIVQPSKRGSCTPQKASKGNTSKQEQFEFAQSQNTRLKSPMKGFKVDEMLVISQVNNEIDHQENQQNKKSKAASKLSQKAEEKRIKLENSYAKLEQEKQNNQAIQLLKEQKSRGRKKPEKISTKKGDLQNEEMCIEFEIPKSKKGSVVNTKNNKSPAKRGKNVESKSPQKSFNSTPKKARASSNNQKSGKKSNKKRGSALQQDSPDFGGKNQSPTDELANSLFNKIFGPSFEKMVPAKQILPLPNSNLGFGVNLRNSKENREFSEINQQNASTLLSLNSNNQLQSFEEENEPQASLNSRNSNFFTQPTFNSVRQVLPFEQHQQSQQPQQQQQVDIATQSFFQDFLASLNASTILQNNSNDSNMFNSSPLSNPSNNLLGGNMNWGQSSSNAFSTSFSNSHKIYAPSPTKLSISPNSSFKFSPSPLRCPTPLVSSGNSLNCCSVLTQLKDKIIPLLESKIKNKFSQDNEKEAWLCEIVEAVRQVKVISVEQLVRGEYAMLLEQVYDALLTIQEFSKRNYSYVLSLIQRTIADLDRKIIAHLHDYSRVRGEKYKINREREQKKHQSQIFIKIEEDKEDDCSSNVAKVGRFSEQKDQEKFRLNSNSKKFDSTCSPTQQSKFTRLTENLNDITSLQEGSIAQIDYQKGTEEFAFINITNSQRKMKQEIQQ